MTATIHRSAVPELAVVNGHILTGLPDGSVADALTVSGGRVLAVGSAADLEDSFHSSTDIIDAGGRSVVPGLIDSHLHVARAGLNYHQVVDWTRVGSLNEALDLIAKRAQFLSAGEWIAVWGGWHPGQFSENGFPTPKDLTRAAPDNPVYVQFLYERAYLNDAGLAACDVVARQPDRGGDGFERHDDGSPTGVVLSRQAMAHCLAAIGDLSLNDRVSSTRDFLARLAELGVTGVIDPGGGGMTPDNYQALYRVWESGDMPVRVRLLLSNNWARTGEEMKLTKTYVRHQFPGFGDPMLKVVGIGEKLTGEYSDGEGLTDHVIDPAGSEKLLQISRFLAERGWPVHLHAIRRATVSSVLDVWEKVDAELPLAERRFALAHADAISLDDVERAARMGVGVAIQNRLVFRSADSARAWGEDIARSAPPLRSLLDRGVPVGGGTDGTNVTPYDPWLSIWWMVTGESLDGAPPRDPAQRLSRQQALEVYTHGSAWFSREEHDRGRLAPGYWADFAVLSDHYLDVPADGIRELRSVLTVVGGRVVHSDL